MLLCIWNTRAMKNIEKNGCTHGRTTVKPQPFRTVGEWFFLIGTSPVSLSKTKWLYSHPTDLAKANLHHLQRTPRARPNALDNWNKWKGWRPATRELWKAVKGLKCLVSKPKRWKANKSLPTCSESHGLAWMIQSTEMAMLFIRKTTMKPIVATLLLDL